MNWLRHHSNNANARLRLFCFPYAGGAASIYRQWHQHLPADIEVCPVQLPGRENRIQDDAFTNMAELVRTLIPILHLHLDKPFAFFGHSMGALIAYEMAQALQQQGGPMPIHLFASGQRAPFLPYPDPWVHGEPSDDAFLKTLQKRYNNIPALILEEPEMRDLYVPLLRADFELVETYKCTSTTPLSCPIVTLGGDDDPHAPEQTLRDWHKLTQSDFKLHMLAGGHFFLNEQVQTQRLLTIVASYLAEAAPARKIAYV